MAIFLMLGKYSSDALKGMSGERTKKAVSAIEKSSGKVKSMYALLGKYDLALVVDFPDVSSAMKASLGLRKLTGVSFTTSPAISIQEFDKLIS